MLIIKSFEKKNKITFKKRIFHSNFFNYIRALSWKKLILFAIITPPFLIGTKSLPLMLSKSQLTPQIIKDFISDTYLVNIMTKSQLKKLHKIPINYINSLRETPDQLSINIKHSRFKNIIEKRNNALRNGLIIKKPTDRQNVTLTHAGKNYKARIRLKGDLLDHVQGSQWSYRVDMRGENSLFGMKKFSLQTPRTRKYMTEWLFHRLLKHEDLPYLRTEFLRLNINGKNYGIYNIEESFDKILIESNRYREGPIVSLNEKNWFREYQRPIKLYISDEYNYEEEVTTRPIETFQKKVIFANEELHAQYDNAFNLLEGFISGRYKAHQVFEIDKFAKFLAIVDLTGSIHSTHWNQLRYYYNPLTKRLIPIGYDADGGIKIVGLQNSSGTLIRAFEDLDVSKEYSKALAKISSDSYWQNFLNENKEEIIRNQRILNKSYPWYRYEDDYIKHNAQVIRQLINPIQPINSYIQETKDRSVLVSLANRQSFPIKIIGITHNNQLVYTPKNDLIIKGRDTSKSLLNKDFEFKQVAKKYILDDQNIKNLSLQYSILGLDEVLTSNVFYYSRPTNENLSNDLVRTNSNIEEFDFLIVDQESKMINIKPGSWILNKTLITPPGYTLKAPAGLNLTLSGKGMILARGPLQFIGSSNDLINISSQGSGNGLVVLNANVESTFKNVVFKNLGAPREKGWGLTGAITFYKSPINITRCSFIENNSEDSINILNSDFRIDNSDFSTSKSDALDVDFGSGVISNVIFKNIGNDAIDISGSNVFLNNIKVDGAGDKAISVGEKSYMKITNLEIRNASIGIASKDMSTVETKGISIDSTKLAFTAFQKKPEYGPASLIIQDSKKLVTSRVYLLESPSTIVLDAKPLPPNVKKVEEYLYGVLYGRSSK